MKITIKDLYDFNLETGYVDDGHFKVHTKNGLKQIEAVDITAKNSEKLKIQTSNFYILVSPEHLLFKYDWVKTNTLKIGEYIDTINGHEEIISINKDSKLEDLYDLQVADEEFYANGIRSHNSTIKQAMELCLFGKVQGKQGKRLALTKLPNRINSSLFTGIHFENHKGDNIVMERYIKPNRFEMFVNEEPYVNKFKTMNEKEREDIIGYSFEVFKSFISLNINDFKNFISLSKEDKENLLNKLFNISVLDDLYSITNELDKNNNKDTNIYENNIYENELKINEYRQTIINIKNKQKINKEEKINNIKQEILDKKPRYNELIIITKDTEDKLVQVKKKMGKLTNLKSGKLNEKNKFELRIENLNEKIIHFESGSCPICDNDLKDNKHIHLLDDMKKDRDKVFISIGECNKYLDRCVIESTRLSNQNSTAYNEKILSVKEFNTLKSELTTLNNQYKNLKNEEEVISIVNLEENINEIKLQNKEYNNTIDNLKKKSETYLELKGLFSTNGIRKNLIKNIIIPVNKYLNDFLIKLNSEYNAVLDENFDAKIFERKVNEIDPETISKGEDRKINIAIALSYLKVVLDKKFSNVMFLDEIFDGLDSENIDLILNLLKDITREHNINIIIVHHDGINRTTFFDKVIKTTKNIFSNLSIQ